VAAQASWGCGKITVGTDDSQLLPQWREVGQLAATPLLKSDLLHWSILQPHGNWYDDCDARTRLALDTVEKERKITAERCQTTKAIACKIFDWTRDGRGRGNGIAGHDGLSGIEDSERVSWQAS
jgi:hypothetical protein